ncbi:MAG: hypothetical protein ACREPT_05355 [Rudaea sp.]
MTATEQSADAARAEASAAQPEDGATLSDLSAIAQHGTQYARAWGALLISEAALAKVNLVRILVLMLVVPALALGALLSIDALLATLAQRWLQDWNLAICSVFLLNIAALLGTLMLLRSWWRSLSLPHSRAALARLIKSLP